MSYQTFSAAPAEKKSKKTISLQPAEGWFTILLIVIMTQIVIGATESMQWTSGISVITGTSLLGSLLGFLFSKAKRIPQWISDIAAILIGAVYSLYITAQAETQGDISVILSRLVIWAQTVTSGQSSNDSAIFLLLLAMLTLLLGYITMWMILRNRNPWLAVTANCVVLLINLNYATDTKFYYMAFFIATALLLLIRVNFVELQRIWKKKHLRLARDITWDYSQIGVIFVTVVLFLTIITPGNITNGSLQNLWNGPNSPLTQLNTAIQNQFQKIFFVNGGPRTNGASFGTSVTLTGSVSLSNAVFFTYTSNDITNTYLQGLAFDQFDGRTWTQTQQKTYLVATNTLIQPETTIYSKVATDITLVNYPSGNFLFTVGEPGSANVSLNVKSDGIGLTSGDTIGSYTAWISQTKLHAKETLQTVSYVSNASNAQLELVPDPGSPQAIAQNLYPAAFLKQYTQLPQDLNNAQGDKLRATINQIVAPYTNMYDKVFALVQFFQNRANGFTYSLNNANAPDNIDGAVWLLQTRSGFCTWYATTLAVMARALGYPARVMEGFTPGSLNPGTSVYTVSGSDFHMWTQVYFPGYGWINFEPTPSFSGFYRFPPPAGSGSSAAAKPPTRAKSPTQQQSQPTTTPIVKTATNPIKTTPSTNVNTVEYISLSGILALLLLAAIGLFFWVKLLARGLSPIGAMFWRMAVLGRYTGMRVTPSQTASEFGAALSQKIPEHATTITEITSQYIEERWSNGTARQSFDIIQKWKALRSSLIRTAIVQAPLRMLRGKQKNREM